MGSYFTSGGSTPDGYPQQYTFDLACAGDAFRGGEAWIYTQGGGRGSTPSEQGLSRLFDAPNPDGTGPFGIPLADLYVGAGGWNLPGASDLYNWSGGASGGCAPPPPFDPNTLVKPHQNPRIASR